MISIYKRRRIRSVVQYSACGVLGVAVLIGLMYTPLLSVNSTSVDASTKELRLYAQREAGVFLEGSYAGLPGRAIHLVWHKPIEEKISEHIAVEEVSISWDWFNMLSIDVQEHTPFAYFCLNNATQYQGDCSIFDKNGNKFASGLTYSTDGLIHLAHKNLKDGDSLAGEHFKVLAAVVGRLEQSNVTVKQVDVERYGEQSTILTLHTDDGTEININPHKEARTLFALDKALLYITQEEEGNIASVARVHLYDPTRIAYWRKGAELKPIEEQVVEEQEETKREEAEERAPEERADDESEVKEQESE